MAVWRSADGRVQLDGRTSAFQLPLYSHQLSKTALIRGLQTTEIRQLDHPKVTQSVHWAFRVGSVLASLLTGESFVHWPQDALNEGL